MTIISKERPKTVPFGDLPGGSVFEWEDDFYLKTLGDEMVRLNDGQPDALDLDTPVRPVDAILTIS